MRTAWSIGASVLAIVAGVTGSGCSAAACKDNGDCHNGYSCLNQTCVANDDAGPGCIAGAAQCATGSDCPTGACVSGCCASLACSTGTPCPGGLTCVSGICQAASTMSSCTSDSACATTPATPFCLSGTMTCVACLTSANCKDTRLECSSQNTCTFGLGYCATSADCMTLGNTPLCNTADNTCVQCLANADCVGGLVCSSAGACAMAPAQPCTGDSSCTATPATPHCDTSNGLCVGCTASTQCGPGQTCQQGSCLSQSCTSDADCVGNAAGSHCDSAGECAQCATASQCATGQTCQSGTCITGPATCTTNGDCAGSPATPYCATALGMCVQCTNYSQCSTAQKCELWTCTSTAGGACQSDSDCLATPATPVCEPSLNLCVQCLSASAASTCPAMGTCDDDVCFYGCAQLESCLNDCSTQSCQESCIADTTLAGEQLFETFYECVFTTYCPSTGGGICDDTVSGYNATDCEICSEEAQGEGGPCYDDNLICQAD